MNDRQPVNPDTSKITALYERLSSEDDVQSESCSIQNQKAMLEKYAADNGFPNPRHFSDDGYSGGNFERPDFMRMIDDAKEGVINLILCKDLSRFGRNYIQTGQFTDYIFPSIGCRFIALNDGVDTINNDNDIMPLPRRSRIRPATSASAVLFTILRVGSSSV